MGQVVGERRGRYLAFQGEAAMATVISKEEAYAQLTDVLNRAMAGEEIVIEQEGRPRLKLIPVDEPLRPQGKRKFGGFEGRIKEAPGVWDPMSDDELREIGLL
jgi:prevent-host-death family protein